MTSFQADAIAHALRGEGEHVFAGTAGRAQDDSYLFTMADPALARVEELDLYLTHHFLPLRRAGAMLVVASADGDEQAWLEIKFGRLCTS